jgi:hypothetical protein
MHGDYLVDPSRLDVAGRRTPSTMIGVQLCASFTAAQAVKLLLGRGKVEPAPFHYHFDSYLCRFEAGPQPGNAAPAQKQKGDQLEQMFRERLGLARA